MKRFWKDVALGDGHRILLDGRPVRTPAKHELLVPSKRLAEAIAEEWRAQEEEVRPHLMPLTRLATSVVDLMPERRPDAIRELVEYARTDLLCYRADQPADLVARQEAHWQAWLDWAVRDLDAPLLVTSGIDPIEQPETSISRLQGYIAALDDWRLVGLHAASKLTGSLVLGAAVEQGVLGSATAFEVALLEELYEIERWGEEEEQRRRHDSLRRDLDAATRFLELISAPNSARESPQGTACADVRGRTAL